jgi:ferric-dicitrate binding protein FerR (iron transport regulator)
MPRHSTSAARLLAKYLPSAEHAAGSRKRGIEVIEEALRARARRRMLKWALNITACVAAVVLAVQAPRWWSSVRRSKASVSIDASPAGRGAAITAGNEAVPMPNRAELEPGQRIDTPPEGGASLRFSTGTAMDLSGRTSFRVESQGTTERFSLQRGELAAHVAKLGAGQRFIVGTPDAEIEVRGTRFRLRVLDASAPCGLGTRTRLDVNEGLVEVRSAGTVVQIRAGEHWPGDCAESGGPAALPRSESSESRIPSARVPTDPELDRVTKRHNLGRALRPVLSPSASPPEPTSLGEQNDLFEAGVALHRRGDSAGALRVYAELIMRFPSSPLAENALAARMRILASGRDPGARIEAERYLARYPNGFAAQEARRVATSP